MALSNPTFAGFLILVDEAAMFVYNANLRVTRVLFRRRVALAKRESIVLAFGQKKRRNGDVLEALRGGVARGT